MVAKLVAAESSAGEPREELPPGSEISTKPRIEIFDNSEVTPTNPREFLSGTSEMKPVKKGYGKDVHPKALARQRRASSAGSPSVCSTSSGKEIHPRALQRADVDDNASVCSDISEITSNTNWTSVREVGSRSFQQSKQKRNLEPTRRSLANISESKPADQSNCRASMQVDAQRQPQAEMRQTEQEPSQKGHQPQVGGQRSSSGLSVVTHSSTQAMPSQSQQVRRESQTGPSIQRASSGRSMARGSSASSMGVPQTPSPQVQNMVQKKSAGTPMAHRAAGTPERKVNRSSSSSSKRIQEMMRTSQTMLKKLSNTQSPLDPRFWRPAAWAGVPSCIKGSPAARRNRSHATLRWHRGDVTFAAACPDGLAQCLVADKEEIWWPSKFLKARKKADSTELDQNQLARAYDRDCHEAYNYILTQIRKAKQRRDLHDTTKHKALTFSTEELQSLLTKNIMRGLAVGYRGMEMGGMYKRMDRSSKIIDQILVRFDNDGIDPNVHMTRTEKRRKRLSRDLAAASENLTEVDRVWAHVIALGDQVLN
jgi:hypothetical protein